MFSLLFSEFLICIWSSIKCTYVCITRNWLKTSSVMENEHHKRKRWNGSCQTVLKCQSPWNYVFIEHLWHVSLVSILIYMTKFQNRKGPGKLSGWTLQIVVKHSSKLSLDMFLNISNIEKFMILKASFNSFPHI